MNSPRKPGDMAHELLAELVLDQPRHINGLDQVLNATKRQISDAAAMLARRGLLKREKRGLYRLTERGEEFFHSGARLSSGPMAAHGKVLKHRDTFRERVWRSIRIRRHFTIGEVVSDAARDGERDAHSNAGRYIRTLVRAGYVRELQRRQEGAALTSNGFKAFVLTKNTGPIAPVWRPRCALLHDFNTGEDIHVDGRT